LFNQYLINLAANTQYPDGGAARIEGEILSQGPFATTISVDATHFNIPIDNINAGRGNAVSLHNPALISLAVLTEDSDQDFSKLVSGDAALQSAFFDEAGISGPLSGPRADPDGSTSKITTVFPAPPTIYDSLWKTFDPNDKTTFYSQFYARFGAWLSEGAVAQGKSANKDDPLSFHDAVVDLGLQVVRDAIKPGSGSTTQDIISDDGLHVFSSTGNDGSPPGNSPPNGYVQINIADIPNRTNEELQDPNTHNAYGVVNITYNVAKTLIDNFSGDEDTKEQLAGQVLGAQAAPVGLLEQVTAGRLQLDPWDTLIVQAGTEQQVDPMDPEQKKLIPHPFKIDATALDLKSAVIFGGAGSTLPGSPENSRDETIKGSKGNDVLVSGGADTTFLGSAGRDLIIGGANTDTYIAQKSSSASDDTTFE
jgi:hypothetical protein